MRVISQDGTMDFPYEISTIFIHPRIENVIEIQSAGDSEVSIIARYSSREKALKAMEMLREQYKRLETLKLYTKGSREDIREILTLDELGCTILKTRKLSVFQFPQDNEIEV